MSDGGSAAVRGLVSPLQPTSDPSNTLTRSTPRSGEGSAIVGASGTKSRRFRFSDHGAMLVAESLDRYEIGIMYDKVVSIFEALAGGQAVHQITPELKLFSRLGYYCASLLIPYALSWAVATQSQQLRQHQQADPDESSKISAPVKGTLERLASVIPLLRNFNPTLLRPNPDVVADSGIPAKQRRKFSFASIANLVLAHLQCYQLQALTPGMSYCGLEFLVQKESPVNNRSIQSSQRGISSPALVSMHPNATSLLQIAVAMSLVPYLLDRQDFVFEKLRGLWNILTSEENLAPPSFPLSTGESSRSRSSWENMRASSTAGMESAAAAEEDEDEERAFLHSSRNEHSRSQSVHGNTERHRETETGTEEGRHSGATPQNDLPSFFSLKMLSSVFVRLWTALGADNHSRLQTVSHFAKEINRFHFLRHGRYLHFALRLVNTRLATRLLDSRKRVQLSTLSWLLGFRLVLLGYYSLRIALDAIDRTQEDHLPLRLTAHARRVPPNTHQRNNNYNNGLNNSTINNTDNSNNVGEVCNDSGFNSNNNMHPDTRINIRSDRSESESRMHSIELDEYPISESLHTRDLDASDRYASSLGNPSGMGRFRERKAPSCPLCLEEVDAPAAVQCGHVFCWACIVQYAQSGPSTSGERNSATVERSGKNLKCPVCRAEFASQRVRALHYNHTAAATHLNTHTLSHPLE